MPLPPIERATNVVAGILVQPPDPGEVEAVSDLFTEIVTSLPYYNEKAKSAEIAKYTPGQLRRAMAADVEAVLIAKIDRSLAGLCFSHADDDLIWLSWFAVSRCLQRRGIGTALLRHLEDRARRAGSHKIWCDCRTENLASRIILKRCGYLEIGTAKNHWYRQDFILWERFVV